MTLKTTAPPIEAYRIALAGKSLADFTKQAWEIVEPDKQLAWNWHHDAICEYAEAVSAGEIRNLLITVPPRHTKSTIISVMLPPWRWIQGPATQYLYASHDGTLAIEHSLKCRRIVESDWYQHRWGHTCAMAEDQNEKRKFENTAGGHRIATSVGGSVIGKGGDVLIVDDPHKIEDAETEGLVTLKTACAWFDGTLSSRLNDPKTSCRIVVMQRIHQADLGGHVLQRSDWEHLNLPSISETHTVVRVPSGKEIVREESELLWPDRFGEKEIKTAKEDLGSFRFAAQHQQNPEPPGGLLIKSEWWKSYTELPNFDLVIQSWDTAFKKKQHNDYSVCLTVGSCQSGFYIIDCWYGRIEFPELKRQAIASFDAYPEVRSVLVEDKASGQSLVQELRRGTDIPVLPIKVDQDKVARVNAVSPLIEAGKVFIPIRAAWLDFFLRQIDSFPGGEYDDAVDALTQALNWLSKRAGRVFQRQVDYRIEDAVQESASGIHLSLGDNGRGRYG